MAGLVFMLSFLLQMIYNMNPIVEDLKYFNILHYTNSSSILLKGDSLILENFLPLLIAVLLITFGIILFLKRDPLPIQIRLRTRKVEENGSTKGRSMWTFFNRIISNPNIYLSTPKVPSYINQILI